MEQGASVCECVRVMPFPLLLRSPGSLENCEWGSIFESLRDVIAFPEGHIVGLELGLLSSCNSVVWH